MNHTKLRFIGLLIGLLFVLSACATPEVYRPEVDAFKLAASEVDTYVKAKQNSTKSFRDSLRVDVLKKETPIVELSAKCSEALENLNRSSPDLKKGADCKLIVSRNDRLTKILNPQKTIQNSVKFAGAVSAYASALDKVAKSGNKEAFQEAAKGLGDAVISLAGSAAEAAERNKPDPEVFTPIANFVAISAYYILENQKTEALKTAAITAQEWIEIGSEAVDQVMLSSQFEIASSNKKKVLIQLDKLNESSRAEYISEADKAIIYTNEFRQQLTFDPGLPFKKLPHTHKKLLAAFEDRKRHLAAAIAVAQDLYKAAKDSYEALKKEEE